MALPTRTLERMAAAMGDLASAPVRFEAADIAEGGVLLAMMALARLIWIEQLRYVAPANGGICWVRTAFRKCAVRGANWRC
jgi:hypothetical protein